MTPAAARTTRRTTRLQRASAATSGDDVPPPSPEDISAAAVSHASSSARSGHSKAQLASSVFESLDTTQRDEEIAMVCDVAEKKVKMISEKEILLLGLPQYHCGSCLVYII